jgi:peptidoglycan/LPS O-acetylase OafA/YrhL
MIPPIRPTDLPTVPLRARPSATDADPPPVRLHEIDLLRIGAALAVVAFHYLYSGPAAGHVDLEFPVAGLVARYGYLGVDLFFVISGFVVLMCAWQRTPRAFVVARVVRLYPAYWVAVTLTAVVSALIGGALQPVTVGRYLADLTMLNPLVGVENLDVVHWTLGVELRFYAVVAVLLVLGLSRRRVLTGLWIWLAAVGVVQGGLLGDRVGAVLDLVVQSQFAHYFIAGAALYLIRRFGVSGEVAALVVLCLGNALHRGAWFALAVAERYRTEFSLAVVLGVITAIFLVMGLVAVGATRALGRPWFAVAGDLTYPLYLVHAHLGFVLIGLLDDRIARWPLVLGLVVVMLGVAHLIHIGVQRPLAGPLRRGVGWVLATPPPGPRR